MNLEKFNNLDFSGIEKFNQQVVIPTFDVDILHGYERIGFTVDDLDKYVEKKLTIFKEDQPYLSICYIVKNEPDNLEKSLKNSAKFDCELLVLDSSDNSEAWEKIEEICFDYKARYLYSKFQNFSQARNQVKANAKGKFILMIDADEDFNGDPAQLKELLENTTTEAFQVIIKNYSKVDDKITFSFSPAIRLFRNKNEYKYSGFVHEDIMESILSTGVDFKEKVNYLDNFMIVHYGYLEPNEQPKKIQRNFNLLTQEIENEPSANAYYRRALIFKDFFKDVPSAEKDISAAILYTSSPNFDELGLKIQILNLGAVISFEIGSGQDAYNRATESLKITNKQILPKVILGDLALTINRKDIARDFYRDALNSYKDVIGTELYAIPPEAIQQKLDNYCGNIFTIN